jgi:hypothetical protein
LNLFARITRVLTGANFKDLKLKPFHPWETMTLAPSRLKKLYVQ